MKAVKEMLVFTNDDHSKIAAILEEIEVPQKDNKTSGMKVAKRKKIEQKIIEQIKEDITKKKVQTKHKITEEKNEIKTRSKKKAEEQKQIETQNK